MALIMMQFPFRRPLQISTTHMSLASLGKWISHEAAFAVMTASVRRTIGCVLQDMTARFQAAGINEPAESAHHLAAAVAGVRRLTKLDIPLDADALSRAESLTQCRLARMPVQYILKEWDFRELTLALRPPIFIPRPETEQLVELVLEELRALRKDEANVLEVGCGSGAICVSMLHEVKRLKMTAIDMSKEACILTAENAKANRVDDRLSLNLAKINASGSLESSSSDDLAPLLARHSLDLIVSNPPYVLRKDLINLQPEITLYEDLRALDGGADGLSVILPLLHFCSTALKAGARAFIEADPCHVYLLPKALESEKISVRLEKVEKDFCGKDRFYIFQQTAELD